MMPLAEALTLTGTPTIAIVGGGGKTSALFHLARALAPSAVTTTTHLGPWEAAFADRHDLWDAAPPWPSGLSDTGVTLITAPPVPGLQRLSGLTPEAFAHLVTLAAIGQRPLLIEADGSRRLPLKAPAEHEPAIPAQATHVILVAGLSGLGRPLDAQHVHRPEIFARLSGVAPGEEVTPEAVARVLTHPAGGLKRIPPHAHRAVLLNQATTPALQDNGARIARGVIGHFDVAVVTNLSSDDRTDEDHVPTQSAGRSRPPRRVRASVFSVHVPVAAVVLAAGEASRYGAVKQVLHCRGIPLVRAVARVALEAGLSPVHVVVGAFAEDVAAAVAGLEVTVVRNDRWRDGQGTSVSVGVGSLPARTGGAVFLLADQPLVSAALLRALVDAHARGRPPVVAPLVEGHRTSPMLFDRAAFAALAALDGDIGGRALLGRFDVVEVPWADDRVALDVDTPEDYRRLLDRG